MAEPLNAKFAFRCARDADRWLPRPILIREANLGHSSGSGNADAIAEGLGIGRASVYRALGREPLPPSTRSLTRRPPKHLCGATSVFCDSQDNGAASTSLPGFEYYRFSAQSRWHGFSEGGNGSCITISYSTNSSARSIIDGCTARPSALAVLSSMINSIFVACLTGKCCKSRRQACTDSSMPLGGPPDQSVAPRASTIFFASAMTVSLGTFSRLAGLSRNAEVESGG